MKLSTMRKRNLPHMNKKRNPQFDPLIRSLQLFKGQEHEPFYWEDAPQTLLLIHGFMGTPLELKPLASELFQAGWSVQGLLLPGFGAQFDTFFTRQWTEWTNAAYQAVKKLQNEQRSVVVIGYSMGASVAINVAAETAIDGLVLIAPFWRLGSKGQRAIWQIFKRLVPQMQLFKKVNFGDPRINEFFSKTIPELDVTDPQVQHTIRQLRIPAQFVDQIIGLGEAAEQASAKITVPTHIVQGTKDKAVPLKWTRQLLQHFPGPVAYEEVEADHEIIEYHNPGFSQMAHSVLSFANRIVLPDVQTV